MMKSSDEKINTGDYDDQAPAAKEIANVNDDDSNSSGSKQQNNTEVSPPPLWQPDNSTSRCRKCLVEFTPILWRHHCRRCGYIFCNACSSGKTFCEKLPTQPYSMFHPGPGERIRRACLSCAALYPVTPSQRIASERRTSV